MKRIPSEETVLALLDRLEQATADDLEPEDLWLSKQETRYRLRQQP